MSKKQSPTPKPQNSGQQPASSNSEKGFAPAGSADQGSNVQFTPTGQIAPAKSGNSGGSKSGKK